MTDDIEARIALSEITEITEQTLAETFARQPDLDALYRECPSAFWLAPDRDLPALATTLPDRHVIVSRDIRPIAPPPATVTGRGTAMFAAMLTAGPTFAALALAFDGGTAGEPWWRPFSRMALSLMALPLTILFGAVFGLVPIVLATLILSEGGAQRQWLRRPAAWLGAGGTFGVAIAAMFGASAAIGVSLIATSIVCAGIARWKVDWAEPDFA